jgi:hypothetical protein
MRLLGRADLLVGTTKGDVMSIMTPKARRTMLPDSQIFELFDCGPLLLGYAMAGVVVTAAEELAISPAVVEAGLRSGRTLREVAHEFRRDPEELLFALARGAQPAQIDDRTAAELVAAAGRLLDLPLLVGPP